MKLVARIVLLVAILGAMGALMWRALEGASIDQHALLTGTQQRNIAYIATPKRGPRFALNPGSSRFRVLSYMHLAKPLGPQDYSPHTQYRYGLKWLVHDANGAVFAHGTIWVQTRKTKAGFTGTAWRKQSVYYPAASGHGEPCDERLIDVDLEDRAAPGRTVEFRVAKGSQSDQVDLVVFTQYERNMLRRQWLEQTLSNRRKAKLASFAHVRSWNDLTHGEQDAILAHGWARRSSVVEVPTRSLYVTDFHLHEQPTLPSMGEALGRNRRLVYNLVGPAHLSVVVRDPAIADSSAHILRLRARILSAPSDGSAGLDATTVDRTVHAVADGPDVDLASVPSAARAGFDIPAGREASLRLSALVDHPVRASVTVDRAGAILGEPEIVELPDGGVLARPDWKGFTQWEARPDHPLRYVLAQGEHRVGQALRVSLRGIEGQPEASLRYRFLAGDKVLSSGTVAAQDELSTFERLVPQKADASGQPERVQGDKLVTEPSFQRFWIPDGATSFELEAAAGSMLVSLDALTLTDEAQQATARSPYDQAPAGLSWRYAPVKFHAWQSFEPTNIDQLESAGLRRRLRAQARLEPDWHALSSAGVSVPDLVAKACAKPSASCDLLRHFQPPHEPDKKAPARVVRPRGSALSRLIAEPADVQPTRAARVAVLAKAWNATYRTRLKVGAPVSCRIQHGGRVALDYQVQDLGVLGGRLQVSWNGRPVLRRLVRTQRDRVYVHPPSGQRTGRVEVRLERPGGGLVTDGVSLLADCAPAKPTPDATVVRLRRVWRLSAAHRLRLHVTSTPERTPSVHVVAYATWPSAGYALDARVDRGSPKLRHDGPVAQITPSTRTLDFAAAPTHVELQTTPFRHLWGPSFATIPIGTDWQPGRHTVDVHAPTTLAHPVWVRFYARDQ